MTCNALRFSLSAIFLVILLPWVPPKYLALAHTDSEVPDEEEEHEELVQPAASDFKQGRTETMNWLHRFCGGYLSNLYSKYYLEAKKTALFWGVLLGVINTLGSGFQQWGITMTSANKVAFIAGFDLFLTPILALFIPTFKRKWCV
ncbi:hypothetical protein EON63_14525 [archaeon]|nr:MAG: hypothetical protein EON63_14525 [archaeon]